jgi:hypothetical protein
MSKSLMSINLHGEAKQLINSMIKPKVLQLSNQLSCVSIVEANHEASTLADLRRLFLRESAAQEVFVDLVGDYLDEVVKSNDQSNCAKLRVPRVKPNIENLADSGSCQVETDTEILSCSFRFHGRHAGYKPSALMERISKYSHSSPCCCVAALIYLERFQQRCPAVELTSATFQRLVLVASMTANKYLEDNSFCHNKSW